MDWVTLEAVDYLTGAAKPVAIVATVADIIDPGFRLQTILSKRPGSIT